MPEHPQSPDPKRFEVSRSTLWFDRFMGWLIRFGGVAVILSVFGIFYFVVKEVVPLFRAADVEPAGKVEAGMTPAVLGVDEWGEMPFFYDGGNRGGFRRHGGRVRGGRSKCPALADVKVTAHAFDVAHHRVAVGPADGRVGSFLVEYERKFTDGGESDDRAESRRPSHGLHWITERVRSRRSATAIPARAG